MQSAEFCRENRSIYGNPRSQSPQSGSAAGIECHRGKTAGRAPGVFFNERRVRECPVHFAVLAIEEDSGRMPVVRLYKNAFSPVI